jgi:Putative bacterial sensory transduction regulator
VQLDPLSLDQAHELIATHLEGPVAAEPYVQIVEYDPELRRWYVRFTCDGRDATTIYFDLHQRTLRYEVYFLPLPPEHHLELYEFLLARNHTMYGARFSIGPDGDIYLIGRLALEHLSVGELDRIIGVLYELTERWFQPVVQLAYGRRPAPLAEDAK